MNYITLWMIELSVTFRKFQNYEKSLVILLSPYIDALYLFKENKNCQSLLYNVVSLESQKVPSTFVQ